MYGCSTLKKARNKLYCATDGRPDDGGVSGRNGECPLNSHACVLSLAAGSCHFQPRVAFGKSPFFRGLFVAALVSYHSFEEQSLDARVDSLEVFL